MRIAFALLGAVAATLAAPVGAASLTLGTLVDADGGMAFEGAGTFAPTPGMLLGVGAGHHDMEFGGESFSGTSLAASGRAHIGGFFMALSGEHWKDSGELTSRALRAELGWAGLSGVTLSVLVADRRLDAPYATTNLLGQVLQHESRSDGEGVGGAVSYVTKGWDFSARFVTYRYRHRLRGDVAPVVSVPQLLDELDQIGGNLSNVGAATPALQLLDGLGLAGTVQDLLDGAGGVASGVVTPVVELADDTTAALPLPLPTVRDLLALGLLSRVQQVIATPTSLVAGAPDRELALSAGREFTRTRWQADWVMQRDALTRDRIHVASLTFGYRFSERFGVDATAGMADSGATGRLGYGGLSLTLRSAP